MNMISCERIQEYGSIMKAVLGMKSSSVGVRFLREDEDAGAALRLSRHRYCQALMQARRGQDVVLLPDELSCPGAASAFGFRDLPAGLSSGKGLVGFGIVADAAAGKAMLDSMTRLYPNQIYGLRLFPLEKAPVIPDVVVVEEEVERLMWIVLSYLHAKGGKRVEGSTAVLQATCVDSTIIPFVENRLNFSYGCYGCRDATDIGPNEAVLGFPASYLPPIIEHLEFLSRRAIPVSRSKKALESLDQKETHGCDDEKMSS